MKAKWTHALMLGALALPIAGHAQTPSSGDTRDSASPSTAPAANTRATTGPERSAGTTAADAAITAKVKTQLIKDKDVSAMNVNVDTMNGVVTLKGNAKSRAEADKAASLARSVDGVKSVKNDLVVGAAASNNKSSGASTGAAARTPNASTAASPADLDKEKPSTDNNQRDK